MRSRNHPILAPIFNPTSVLSQKQMSSLLGHEKILELLKRYARDNRPAHAYLFSGRQGVGKKRAALEFACMINCPDFSAHDTLTSCNTCGRILCNTHPDIHIEQPERNLIRIDAIRKIISFIKYPPIEISYRFVIIDDAHLMNRSAQNALLKTLEEPPANRIIILVTSQPSSLLQTVRSRLRRISFGPLSDEHLEKLLSNSKNMSPEALNAALAMASGSIERALSKAAPKNVEFRRRVISTLFEKIDRPYYHLVELSAEAGTERVATDDLLEIAAGFLRDVIVTKLDSNAPLINTDYEALIKRLVSANSINRLMMAYDEILKASDRLDLDINLGKNLVLDVTFLKIEGILKRA